MAVGDRFADCGENVPGLLLVLLSDLLHEDQFFLATAINRERNTETRCDRLVATAHRGLYILRVVINTANDNQVFQPTVNVEFAIVFKAQIAGAEIMTL